MSKLNTIFLTVFIGIFLVFCKGTAMIPEPYMEPPEKKNREEKINSFNKKHQGITLDAEQLYYLSLLYISNDNLEKAKEVLNEALTNSPQFVKAYLQLGFIFLWQNKLIDASSSFSMAMQYAPCDKKAMAGLQQVALLISKEKGNEEEAIKIYRELILCHPNNSDYFFYLGQVLANTHQWDEAEMVLKKCLDLAPQYTDAALLLASIYFREKKLDEAEKIYGRYPNNKEAQIALHRFSLKREINEKVKSFTIGDEGGPQLCEELYEVALLHIEMQELEKAKEYLEKALEICPRLAKAHTQLGFIFLKENNLGEAKYAFELALLEAPCDKQSLYGLGQIASIWSKEDSMCFQAIELYRELLLCYPNNSDYLFWLGHLLVKTGQGQAAEWVFQECLRITPNYINASFELGALYMRDKRWCEAEEIYHSISNHVEAEERLAKIAYLKGDYALAEDRYKQLVLKYPNAEKDRDELAYTLQAELKFREAKENYIILTQQNPKEQKYWRELFEVKQYTDPAIFLEARYIEAKEDDPSLKAPVVKDYYFDSALHVLLAPFDQWQLAFNRVLVSSITGIRRNFLQGLIMSLLLSKIFRYSTRNF